MLALHLQSQNILDTDESYIIFIILSLHLQSQNILDTDESYIIFIILSLHLQSQNILDTDESYIIFITFFAAFAEPKYFRYWWRLYHFHNFCRCICRAKM